MQRTLVPELMDDPGISREDLGASLAYIRFVNRRLGGASALVRHLCSWSRGWPRDRAVTLLDIGTGSADIPLAALAWARRAGFDLRVTGVDLHETTLALAREHIGEEPAITLLRSDARTLTGRFGPGSFDYVHAGMFLHHLPDEEVLAVLRTMGVLARAGVVWNDLVRAGWASTLVRLLLVGQPVIVRHDAVVSIRAGFTRAEALDLGRRAGLGYAAFSRTLFYRFTLAGQKEDAWPRLEGA